MCYCRETKKKEKTMYSRMFQSSEEESENTTNQKQNNPPQSPNKPAKTLNQSVELQFEPFNFGGDISFNSNDNAQILMSSAPEKRKSSKDDSEATNQTKEDKKKGSAKAIGIAAVLTTIAMGAFLWSRRK